MVCFAEKTGVSLTNRSRTSELYDIGEYVYDALGRRIHKTADSTTTDFLYDSMQCVEERVSDSMTKQYVWGQYIDEVLQLKTSSATYYPMQDLLYRTNKLTSDAGAVVETYDCDAYGRTLMFDSLSQAITAPTCEFIFTGRRYDPETGLYFYRTRYYSPELGRFISKDSLNYIDSMGLYEYCRGIAFITVDPYGEAVIYNKITVYDLLNLNVKEFGHFVPIGDIWSTVDKKVEVTSVKDKNCTPGCKRYTAKCIITRKASWDYELALPKIHTSSKIFKPWVDAIVALTTLEEYAHLAVAKSYLRSHKQEGAYSDCQKSKAVTEACKKANQKVKKHESETIKKYEKAQDIVDRIGDILLANLLARFLKEFK